MTRYGILLVFSYHGTLSKSGTPAPLLGMENDIIKSYHMSTKSYGIPRNNITIITDIRSKNSSFPWEKYKEGPKVIKLPYPSINSITEAIIQTMNNIQKEEVKNNSKAELFVYYSGHGMLHPLPIKNYTNDNISSLILVDSTGKERRYLTRRELTNLFYSLYQPDQLGMLAIPVLERKSLPGLNITNLIYELTYIMVDTRSEGIIKNKNINVFFMYDACHSASLSGLRFRYMNNNSFEEIHDENIELPLSVGISATNDKQEAPSCTDGSPFTSQIYDMFEKRIWNDDNINVINLHTKIHQYLHPILRKKCYPTVNISMPDLKVKAPIISSVN